MVGSLDGEAQRLIQLDCSVVGRIDEQHAAAHTAPSDRVEPRHSECATESETVEVGVHCDHVDFALDRLAVVVEFGPAKPGEPTGAFVKQESGRIEPRLSFALAEHRSIPATLLAVTGERSIVHLEPCRFVQSDTERSNGDIGARLVRLIERQVDLHLVHRSLWRHSCFEGH